MTGRQDEQVEPRAETSRVPSAESVEGAAQSVRKGGLSGPRMASVLIASALLLGAFVWLLADYLRGYRQFPSTSKGMDHLVAYLTRQEGLTFFLFGREAAQRRIAAVLVRQKLVEDFEFQHDSRDVQLKCRLADANEPVEFTVLIRGRGVDNPLLVIYPLCWAVIIFSLTEALRSHSMITAMLFGLGALPTVCALGASTRSPAWASLMVVIAAVVLAVAIKLGPVRAAKVLIAAAGLGVALIGRQWILH